MLIVSSFIRINIDKKTSREKDKSERNYSPKEDSFYWYTVRVKIDDRRKQFQIVGAGSKVYYGTEVEFEKAVWQGVAKRQITIGPFITRNQANNSKGLYKKSKEKVDKVPKEPPPEIIYWFAVTFQQSERLKVYIFERTPASVQSGSTNNFVNALYEQLNFQQFSIGPFWDYESAEKAKALYHKNE